METIRIRGARQHNLRDIDVEIPRGKLVVVTGPSGSGKSSLAFHTLFAEGQRRFMESLSAYARQFLDQLEKPDVDSIEGLSPAVAIEQRSGGLNPRSTVATVTEIYEHLRVLWAAAGVPHDPVTGEKLERMTSAEMVEDLLSRAEGTRLILLAPVGVEEWAQPVRLIGELRRQGFVRVRVNGEMFELEDAERSWPEQVGEVEVVVDRLIVREGVESRLADSMETVLARCGVEARVLVQEPGEEDYRLLSFQTRYRNPRTGFALDGLSPRHFSFNSHWGACAGCEGLGVETYADPGLMVGDISRSVAGGAIRGWWKDGALRGKAVVREVMAILKAYGVSPDVAWQEVPEAVKRLIWWGGEVDTGWKVGVEKKAQKKRYEGLCVEAERKLKGAASEAVRRRLLRVMAERPCRECGGRRLKPEILAVKLEGVGGAWWGIQDFCAKPVEEAIEWLADLKVSDERREICERLAGEIRERLGFLEEVGLGYLGLDRSSGTLSGGEAQRIRLATQLGSGLTGVLYVLDEPSIGLHAADTGRLIGALKRLRDRGNTVVVVEHDEEMILAADWMIEMGPGAGRDGGLVLAQGPLGAMCGESPTEKWLAEPKRLKIGVPVDRMAGELVIRGARAHHLAGMDVRIPLGRMVCLCGPSGSGKSTLADDILLRVLKRHFHGAGDVPGEHDGVEGMELIAKVVAVDQSPIGRSPRSNPATFTGLFDLIREIYAKLPLSRQRGYGAGRFSFNTAGGRCEACQGAGRLRIEMNFLPDAWVTCGSCGGRRFNRETLEVTFKGLSIAQVLELTVVEALEVFGAVAKIRRGLEILESLGLGYLRLGQAANTLSGGEAQRLKLAVELARPTAVHTLYFFDEPTTGLHFGDVERLLEAFRRLREAGHSLLVVEHQLDVIEASDWVIELGPGGGRRGGKVVAEGPPESLCGVAESPTGRALACRVGRKLDK